MVKKKYTEEERVARARAMRREGYNCAQCVILAFDDLLPSESVDTAVLAAQGFGSGYGGRDMCVAQCREPIWCSDSQARVPDRNSTGLQVELSTIL